LGFSLGDADDLLLLCAGVISAVVGDFIFALTFDDLVFSA